MLFNLQDRILQCFLPQRGTAEVGAFFVLARIAVWTLLSAFSLLELVPWLLLGPHLRVGSVASTALRLLASQPADRSLGVAVLGGIAGIGGILLGLYFSTYSAATTQLFDRLPGAVQRAITDEGDGLRYAEGLAILTATTLILSVWVAFGNQLPLGSYAATTIATIAVLGVGLVVARRTSSIFDMSKLAHLIGRGVVVAAVRSSMAHGRSLNPSWQHHQRRIAVEHLHRLRALVNAVSGQSVVQPSDQQRVARVLTRAAVAVLGVSGAIEPRSKWFPTTQRHVWPYAADAFHRRIGLTLGRSAGTALETDYSWVERELIELLMTMLSAEIRRGQFARAAEVVQRLGEVVESIAYHGRWLMALDGMQRLYVELAGQSVSWSSQQEALMLADAITNLDVSFVVGLVRRVEHGHPHLRTLLNTHDWGRPAPTMFRAVGPAYTLALWELQQWAKAERRIEGEVRTDYGHLNQKLLLWSTSDVCEAVASWLRGVEGRMVQYGAIFPEAQDPRLGLLACWHARSLRERMEGLLDGLEQGLPSSPPDDRSDLSSLRLRLTDARQAALSWIEAMAQREAESIDNLLPLSTAGGEPYWFADTVQHLAGDCIQALKEGRDELLASRLEPYFRGAMAAVWVAGAPESVTDPAGLMKKWRPFIELLEISGLAYMYAALGGTAAPWQLVCAAWNAWLSEDGERKLDQLVAVYALYAAPLGILGEGEVVLEWRQHLLRETDKLPKRPRPGPGLAVAFEYDHPDPEIARLGRHWLAPEFSGRDVFARRYLRRRCDSGARRYARQ